MNQSYHFLQGGGHTGELIRSTDWSQTAFGSPATWPDSLKQAISISLNSGFPIAIYWGPDFNIIYNDAYSAIPGNKHPWALGKPGREAWAEIWEGLDAQFKSVLSDGKSIRVPDALLLMHRYGYTEECYFDYTLSPIIDINGHIGGVFNAVIETTYRVINERRNQVLFRMTQQLNAQSFADGVQQSAQFIAAAKEDIPFSLLYTSVNGNDLKLSAASGIDFKAAAQLQWPQAQAVLAQGTMVHITELPQALSRIHSHWPEDCVEAVIAPLAFGDAKVTGYIVMGISPRKRLDAEYQHFVQSVAINTGTAINNGYARQQEQILTERIAASENRFRQMLEQSPVPMMVYRGQEMTVTKANAAMLQMLGKSTAIIGLPLTEAMPEIIGQPSEQVLRTVYQTGQAQHSYDAVTHLQRNGKLEEGHFDISYTPLIEDGRVTGVLVVANEVTIQVQARKMLAENEALLRNITSVSPSALWMSDEEGNITYVNETWLEWTGLTFAQCLGNGWASVILEEDRQHAIETFMADLAERNYYEVSFRITTQWGSIANCLATGNPHFDADGNFLGYIGACTDITDKLQHEQQLAKANAQLQSTVNELEFLTDNIPSVLWTSTPDGKLDFINRRWYDRNSTNVQNALGNAWLNNVHPEDRDRVDRAWENSIATGTPYEIEFRLKGEKSDFRWFLVRAVPLCDSDGAVIKWYGTNTDIHEQKILERQKDNFLGVASHELKTPVTSIKAYAQVMETMFKREGNEHKARMIAKLITQVDRLTNLIGDLLDVTKIHTGRLQFNDDYFDFGTMVDEIVEDTQRTATLHRIEKELHFKGEIYGDRHRIGQVLLNLLTNAIKYSPDSERILVYTHQNDNEVLLCVQDFGIGIEKDQCSHVFEQFYRVTGPREHTFPGLGLGLYISSEIIKQEGGRMWVDSELGKGSTFCFALPVNRDA